MSAEQDMRKQIAFEHLMQRCKYGSEVMKPYMNILQSKVGISIIFMISNTANLIFKGLEDPNAMGETINQASSISGIPVVNLNAYLDCLMAFALLSKLDTSNSPVDEDGGIV